MKTMVQTGSPSRADAQGNPQMLYYDKLPKESKWQQLQRTHSFERQIVNIGSTNSSRPTSASIHNRAHRQTVNSYYGDSKTNIAQNKTFSTSAVTNPNYNSTFMSQKYKNTLRQQKFDETAKKAPGGLNSQGSIQTLKNSV